MGDYLRILKKGTDILFAICFLYLTIRSWSSSTQNEQRIMIAIFLILLVGIERCIILFRFCIKQTERFDFLATVVLATIFFIGLQESFPSLSYFKQLSIFQQCVQGIFYSILILNTSFYIVVFLALLIVSVISLIQIWLSSDMFLNSAGLTKAEFNQLPATTIPFNNEELAEQTSAANNQSKPNSAQQLSHAVPECSICLSAFEQGEIKVEMVSCKHAFHSECIRVWFRKSVLCPYCRNDIRKSLQRIQRNNSLSFSLQGHSVLDKIIDQAEPSFSLEEFIVENSEHGEHDYSQQVPSHEQQNQQNNNHPNQPIHVMFNQEPSEIIQQEQLQQQHHQQQQQQSGNNIDEFLNNAHEIEPPPHPNIVISSHFLAQQGGVENNSIPSHNIHDSFHSQHLPLSSRQIQHSPRRDLAVVHPAQSSPNIQQLSSN